MNYGDICTKHIQCKSLNCKQVESDGIKKCNKTFNGYPCNSYDCLSNVCEEGQCKPCNDNNRKCKWDSYRLKPPIGRRVL